MKVLITGACGFTGKYLAEHLSQDEGTDLYLTDRQPENIENYITCDLTRYALVENLIRNLQPDVIYHLAGSFTNNFNVDYNVNVLTTKNILDSLLKLNLICRVLLVGSAAEYGKAKPEDNPIPEKHPLNPLSVYGLTKVYQSYLMKYYCTVHNLHLVMARTFNLFGKGASNKLFVGRIYEQIEKYKKGEVSKIIVGNLKSKRDYIDVKQAVRHYKTIIEHGIPGDIYNVGNGYPVKLSDLLTEILKDAGIDMSDVEKVDHLNEMMMMRKSDLFVLPHERILTAIQKINKNKKQIVLVVDESDKLLGTITDGDIRRAIGEGISFDTAVNVIMNPKPIVAVISEDRKAILRKMKLNKIRQCPVIDDQIRVVNLEYLDDLVNNISDKNRISCNVTDATVSYANIEKLKSL